MKFARARVTNGKLEFDLPDSEEGSVVDGFFFNQTPVRVTDEERQMLLASIESGVIDDARDALEILEELIAEDARR